MNYEEIIKDFLNGADASLRRQAGEQLLASNMIKSEDIVYFAKGLLDSDYGVKDVCVRILSNIDRKFIPEVANAIAPLITSHDIEVRNLSGDIFLKIGSPAEFALIPYLKDDDPQIRQFALDIIGHIATKELFEIIADLLNDSDQNVKMSAIEALGNLNIEESVDRLISIYDENEEYKPMIIESLGKIKGEKAAEFIFQKLKTEDDIFLQTNCIDALAFSTDNKQICNYLLEILPTAKQELQPIILKTIYAVALRLEIPLEIPEELRYISRNALMDTDSDIRAAALIALGNNYYVEDVPSIMNEIQYNNPDTEKFIILNIFTNSGIDVVNVFLESYFSNDDLLVSETEFIEFLANIWNLIDIEVKKITISKIFYIFFGKARGNVLEMIELLLHLEEEETIQQLKIIYQTDDQKIRNDIEEIIRMFNLEEKIK